MINDDVGTCSVMEDRAHGDKSGKLVITWGLDLNFILEHPLQNIRLLSSLMFVSAGYSFLCAHYVPRIPLLSLCRMLLMISD